MTYPDLAVTGRWGLVTGVVGCAVLATLAGQVRAAPVFIHSGGTDPTTEGWAWSPGPGGGIANGVVSGENAWYVDDASTATGSYGSYSQSLTAAEIAQLTTEGWTLAVRMRMPRETTYVSAVWCAFHTGVTRFAFEFERTTDGQQSVRLDKGGYEYTEPVVISDYALVELKGSGTTASLYVDGVLKTSDYLGDGYADSRAVTWGSGSSMGTGQGNWGLVHFTPEPTSLTLLSVVAALALRRRRA